MLAQQGWLNKCGPAAAWKWMWEPRWAGFEPEALRVTLFTDEAKGVIALGVASRATAFTNPSARGPKYLTERPAGFVVDTDPAADSKRELHHFDADSQET